MVKKLNNVKNLQVPQEQLSNESVLTSPSKGRNTGNE